jgi:small subunit ribosomal protein S21
MPRSKHSKEQPVSGLYVEVRNNDVNKAMRKFKKKVAEDGILQDLRKREYFESKGTKRRLEKQAAIRRYKKKRLKEQDNW